MMNTPWYPQVRRGFFHIGDRPFYLFADKVTKTLEESSWLSFDLGEVPCALHNVMIGGFPLPESSVNLYGSTLYVKRPDATGVINVSYGIFDATISDIEQQMVDTSFDPGSGQLEQYLDPVPTGNHPVLFKDPSGLPVEFTVDMGTGKITWFGLPTATGYIPPSGIFEYEGKDDLGPYLDVDLNLSNAQRQAGILNLMSCPVRDIESELF
jgi:hypothetical protein